MLYMYYVVMLSRLRQSIIILNITKLLYFDIIINNYITNKIIF